MVEQLFTSSELGCGKSQDGYWALVASKIGVPVEDLTIFEDSPARGGDGGTGRLTVVAISDRYTVEDEPALRKLAGRSLYLELHGTFMICKAVESMKIRFSNDIV